MGRSRPLLALLAAVSPAAAAPRPPAGFIEPERPAEPRPPTATEEPRGELTAGDVADAPIPGYESGRADRLDGGDGTARAIGRGLLLLPKLAANAALAPVRAGIWAYEHYHLDERYYRVFYNADRTIGLHPTATFESGFGLSGLTGGAVFVDSDLAGEREQLELQAVVGAAHYRQLYAATLRSGDRLGKALSLELDAGYELRPRDAFYGIGNRDGGDELEARYRQRRARVALAGDARAAGPLHVRAAAALSDRTFSRSSEGPPIDQVYGPGELTGFGGVRDAYGELGLRWDDRRAASRLEPGAVLATGSLAQVYAGRVHRLDAGADFWRYGIDLQHFIRLGRGPRVLATRLRGEAVSRRDDVPFVELPALGGGTYLRGYDVARFRDRVAAFASAEYVWDLSSGISASLFVDVGRVFPSVAELSIDHPRVGYGFALQAHGRSSFYTQATVASSIDGGLFLNLAFNPVFDLDERVRRR